MKYTYTYTVADFPANSQRFEVEAHQLRYHPRILQMVRAIAVAAGDHLEEGTFSLKLTLGIVEVSIEPVNE